MLIDGCILHRRQYMAIYYVSHLLLVPLIYAIYKGQYIIGLGGLVVLATSLDYWKKPDYSYRRYIDIVMVVIAISIQTYICKKSVYFREYLYMMIFGIVIFIIGAQHYKNGQLWHSTYSHIIFHLIANISNIVLYSGM